MRKLLIAAVALLVVSSTVLYVREKPAPPSKVTILVRVLNTEDGWLYYPHRLRAFAAEFFKKEPESIGLIAMQQAKEYMTSCPIPPAEDHGAPCFARVLEREYENHGVDLEAASAFPAKWYNSGGLFPHPWEWRHNLGIVAECTNRVAGAASCSGAWRIVSSEHWWIGEDSGGGSARYLLETLLEHPEKGLRFRFYDTHLSHKSDNLGSQSSQRYSQVDRIISIMQTRVQSGELAPILAGDLNFLSDWQSDAGAMSLLRSRFWWVNEHQGSKLHIWVGEEPRWPGTIGMFGYFGNPYLVTLTQPYLIDGIWHSQLSDHDSPGVHLLCKLRENSGWRNC